MVVRGLQRGDPNVLVDGQRVHGACPNRMDPAAFHVDFAEVERVDVARGPFDVRHQGSLGGVVNVVTRRPERGARVSPFASAGSFGQVNPSLTASWGSERVSALAGVSYRVSEPYRDGSGEPFTNAANYRPEASEREAYRVGTGWAQLGWRLGGRHRIQLGWTRQEARGVLYPYLMMDGLSDDTDRVNLAWESTDLEGGAVKGVSARLHYSRVDHWMTDELRTSGPVAPRGWSMGTRAATETGGGRLEARLRWGSVGVEAYRHRWDVETQMAGMQYRPQSSIPGAVNDAVGVFVEGSRRLGAALSFVAGARLDRVSGTAEGTRAGTDLSFAYWGTRSLARGDTLPSGKLRVEWDAKEELELAATLGHTTRVAEGNERYFGLRRMGTDWVGNPDLAPARNTGFEVSATWRRRGALLAATAHASRVDGFVTVVARDKEGPVFGVTNSKARTWDNVDAALWGAEANIGRPAARPPLPLRRRLLDAGSQGRGALHRSGRGRPRGDAAAARAARPALRRRAALRRRRGDPLRPAGKSRRGARRGAHAGMGSRQRHARVPSGPAFARRRRLQRLRPALHRAPLVPAGPVPLRRTGAVARAQRLRQRLGPLLGPVGPLTGFFPGNLSLRSRVSAGRGLGGDMPGCRVALALVSVLGAAPVGARAAPSGAVLGALADGTPLLEPPRLERPPLIDGALDDPAWQSPPLPLGEWVSYNPLNGDRIAQRTEVWVAYDEAAFYFAFRCHDPEPEAVRSTLSRRDQMWNDDWVGLSLDPFGNSQASHDLFVNPAGVQADILTTPSAGENTAPDWVWESAGRRTDAGYEVEIRLPFRSIRMASGDEVALGILFWRRVSRLGISVSWPEVVPGSSFIECHSRLLLRDVERPFALDVIPSVTYARNQTRADPSGFSPAESDPDVGASVKYGVTASTMLDATVNPDFSQVESDAFQVEVNRRFPVFYPEKRPFFMEGMGTFELAGSGGDANMRTAVHTRRIVDPRWGAKVTGTAGRVTYATLFADDRAPGLPEADGGPSDYPGQRQFFGVARAVYGLRKSDYVGVLVTDTELAAGHNRVAAADGSFRFGHHSWSTTLLASDSRAPDGTPAGSGLGAQSFYAYDTRTLVAVAQVEHYDREFQMDTAFLNRTGITIGWAYSQYSFYPDAKKRPWLKRIAPFVFTRHGWDEVQGARESLVLPGIRFFFTRQGWLRFDGGWGHDPWAGQAFPTRTLRAMGGAQLTRWLNLYGYTSVSRAVYYDDPDPFVGTEWSHQLELGLQPRDGLNLSAALNRVTFDRLEGQGRVYAVTVLNGRASYQFDRHLAVRAIVQWDSSDKRVLTDLLGSFELRPGTVAYLGYGSILEQNQWDGEAWRPGTGAYRTMQRGLFVKLSYIHRF